MHRLNFEENLANLKDGRIDVNVEINVDGRVQGIQIATFPTNQKKRKFIDQVPKIIQSGSPYQFPLLKQKETIELSFYFDLMGKFKVRPKTIESSSK